MKEIKTELSDSDWRAINRIGDALCVIALAIWMIYITLTVAVLHFWR